MLLAGQVRPAVYAVLLWAGRRRDVGDASHMGDAATDSLLGQRLSDKYMLEQVIGSGGMATVYAATHRNRKRVAIKVLHPEFSESEDVRSRFLREGYVANTVGHPGAVAVLDDDVSPDGRPYLVMELLQGSSVEDLSSQLGGCLPLVTFFDVALPLLDVLQAAHDQGIVHRDIKPENLFLTTAGALKVLDFGIARLVEPDGGSRTRTGAMMGTPGFMAPEQALGDIQSVDARTDVWSVGATLFKLLSNEMPHGAETVSELLMNAVHPARPLRSAADGVPEGVARVVDRALSVRREDRWSSAAAMRAALAGAQKKIFSETVSEGPSEGAPVAPDLGGRGRAHVAEDAAPVGMVGTAQGAGTGGADGSIPGAGRTNIGTRAVRPVFVLGAVGILVIVAAGVVLYAAQMMSEPATSAQIGGSPVAHGVGADAQRSASAIPTNDSRAGGHRETGDGPSPVATSGGAPVNAKTDETDKTVSTGKAGASNTGTGKAGTSKARPRRRADSRAKKGTPTPACARWLERMSLGVGLSDDERAAFARDCK